MSARNGHTKASGEAPPRPAEANPGMRFTANEARLNAVAEFIMNATMRAEWLSAFSDNSRDVYSTCKVPSPESISPYQYKRWFDGDPIAARICEVFPKECFQVTPLVFEEEDGEKATEFEAAWDELGKGLLGGEESWYQDEDGSPVWLHLRNADILSGIGEYGVILFGFDDVKESLADPVKPKKGMKLLYLREFPQSQAKVARYDTDEASPRFGLPIEYDIDFSSLDSSHGSVTAEPIRNRLVHWTRVQHVADFSHQPSSSPVYAVPRMRAVSPQIVGVQKLYFASPEMYWKGALPGLGLKTNPAAGPRPNLDINQLKSMMKDYEDDLQRWIALINMDIQSLAPQVVDPTPQIDKQIEAICIKLGVPVRVFKGSERGELASSQDDQAWNDRLRERQTNYLTPGLLVPFIDRLIWAGVLPEPKGYSIFWPDLTSKSDQEKATVATTRTDALTKFVGGDGASQMAPHDFWTRFMGFSDEEAATIIENAADHQEARLEEEEAQRQRDMQAQQEMIDKGLAPDPTAPKALPPGKGAPPTAAGGVAPAKPPRPPIPSLNAFEALVANTVREVLTNAKKGHSKKGGKAKLSGGSWKTINGTPVYIKGGKIVTGPKAIRDLTHKAAETSKEAADAEMKGDKSRAKNLRAATYGFHKAAKHVEEGDHARAKVAHDKAESFRRGESKLPSTVSPGGARTDRAEADHAKAAKEVTASIKERQAALSELEAAQRVPSPGLTARSRVADLKKKLEAVEKKLDAAFAARDRAEENLKHLRSKLKTNEVIDEPTPEPTPADLAYVLVYNFSPESIDDDALRNAFCSTGKGGGIDPTCGKGNGTAVASPVSKGKDGATSASKGDHAAPVKPGKGVKGLEGEKKVPVKGGEADVVLDHSTKLAKVLEHTFPNDVDPHALAAASNAAPGAKVTVGLTKGGGAVQVQTVNSNGFARRTFYRDHENKLVCHNDVFINKHDPAGGTPRASGADLLSDQVKALRSIGVDRIETNAARSDDGTPPLVGYKVWPKLGFEGTIPDKVFSKLPPEIRAAMGEKRGKLLGLVGGNKGERSISKLYSIPGGPAAWEQHGTSIDMTFDVKEGSPHMKRLEDYLAKRDAKKKGA